MMRFLAAGAAALALSACDVPPTTQSTPEQTQAAAASTQAVAPNSAARTFVEVVRTVEPVAESECRARTRGVNCDFRIVVDDRPGQPANAFQTLDKNNRPVIAFTVALIAEARNADELAFVLGHEAAHHIEGHIAQQKQNAIAGAVIFSGLAGLTGGNAGSIQSAQRLGAQVGARTHSKQHELEADALGTVITARAGYNPVRGAAFFSRIPDPGDRFLGTHPPNAERQATVRRVAASL
jgi:predicted Zn-dependent protease